jgi:hypothetical protein
MPSTETGIDKNAGETANIPKQLTYALSNSHLTWEDDTRLTELAEMVEGGLPWEHITREFPGRSAESCRNRYERRLR